MASGMGSLDSRKRALDALERRRAVAKAELLHQQLKKEGSLKRESGGGVGTPSSHLPDARKAESSGVSARKDGQAVDPIYAALSQPIHENLLAAPVEISKKKQSRVDSFMHELLQKGDSAPKYMRGSRSMKVDGVILLDNYVKGRSGFASSRFKVLQAHSKRSKLHMSTKKHKKCGSFNLSQDLHKFDHFVPIHEMWKSYIMDLLKISERNQLPHVLLSADLHGAILRVADCKATSFNGTTGIMIRETAQTFGIITRENKFRVVPKKGSVFRFLADCWKITIFGEKLIGRDLGLL